MQVTPSTSVTNTDPTGAVAAAMLPTQTLGQQDFLKLLVTQLSSQDPLNPQTNTDFIAQMAQFTSLEQTQVMQADLAQMRDQQAAAQANALLGRQVTLQADANHTVQGLVTAISIGSGKPQLLVNGQYYSIDNLLSVSLSTN